MFHHQLCSFQVLPPSDAHSCLRAARSREVAKRVNNDTQVSDVGEDERREGVSSRTRWLMEPHKTRPLNLEVTKQTRSLLCISK